MQNFQGRVLGSCPAPIPTLSREELMTFAAAESLGLRGWGVGGGKSRVNGHRRPSRSKKTREIGVKTRSCHVVAACPRSSARGLIDIRGGEIVPPTCRSRRERPRGGTYRDQPSHVRSRYFCKWSLMFKRPKKITKFMVFTVISN